MFNNRRVEEDLERIRAANRPFPEQSEKGGKVSKGKPAASDNPLHLTAKDILAMIIAVLSLLLPYVFIIGGAVVLVILLFLR